MIKPIVIIFSLFLIVFSNNNAKAQIHDDAALWTINLGFLETQSAVTENNLFTYGLNTTIEKKLGDSKIAVGANIGYYWSEDSYNISLDTKSFQSYKSFAGFLTAKYYFTPDRNWSPYVGVGLGIHSTSVDFAASGVIPTEYSDIIVGTRSESGVSVALPLGLVAFVGDDIFLGFNFTPYWQDISFYKDKWYWAFNMGIGFQLD